MSLRKWWYDSKTTKWQILVGTIFITIIFLIFFIPLETYPFDESWEYHSFWEQIIGAMFGGVAVAVITGVLIMFQSVVAMDREKNQKIFDQRVALYKTFLELTMEIVDDDVLDDDERKILMKTEKEILLIASRATYLSWCKVYEEILKLPRNTNQMKDIEQNVEKRTKHEKRVKSISELTAKFVNCCRKDLDIALIEHDDEMSQIMSGIQSEMDKHLFKRTREVSEN
jgi:hypothetical protein